MQLRVVHPQALALAGLVELDSQLAVGAHTAGYHQSVQPGLHQGRQRFFHQHLHNRRLRGGRQIGQYLHRQFDDSAALRGSQPFGLHHHGRLETGKRKIQIRLIQQRARQFVSQRVTALSQARQRRTTRVIKPQQLGRFVKSLTSGIVNGFAQQAVTAHALHPHQLGVAA